MPELPEVETVRRGLEQRTTDMVLQRVEVLRERTIATPGGPADFVTGLQGRRLRTWTRRGKYLIASLGTVDTNEPAGHWGVHLRMTGQFLLVQDPQPVCRHTRVQIWDPQGVELRFIDMRCFAQMWWVPPGEDPEAHISGLKRLGPEPFDQRFDAGYLKQTLKSSRRPIKSALLDQSLVAGVGNIYADESLFAAGIRPHSPANRLTLEQLELLCNALVNVLHASIGAGGTTFSDFRDLTGTNGNYGGVAMVYRRSGLPCHVCGTAILRDRLGGRSSHWCPRCQR
ncbi:MAG: DNA-formamidopyrimidine glycosylase [Cyanobacteriota bacterium]